MPLFEYVCGKCGHRFDKIVPSWGTKPPACPKCGAATKKADVSLPAKFLQKLT